MRQILIGLLIILMLKFRPEGILKERPGVDRESGRGLRAWPNRARTAAATPPGSPSAIAVATGPEVPSRAVQPADAGDDRPTRPPLGSRREGHAAEEGSAE